MAVALAGFADRRVDAIGERPVLERHGNRIGDGDIEAACIHAAHDESADGDQSAIVAEQHRRFFAEHFDAIDVVAKLHHCAPILQRVAVEHGQWIDAARGKAV